jgi:hypothetical protein
MVGESYVCVVNDSGVEVFFFCRGVVVCDCVSCLSVLSKFWYLVRISFWSLSSVVWCMCCHKFQLFARVMCRW